MKSYFNLEQGKLIINLVNIRASSLQEDDEKGFASKLRIANSLIGKISSQTYSFTSSEKLFIISCVNENLLKTSTYFRNTVFSTNPFTFISNLEENNEQCSRRDMSINILEICGYFKNQEYPKTKSNPYLTYNILNTILKLKEADTILLSMPNDAYKIGFISKNNEAIVFEMKSEIRLYSYSFEKRKCEDFRNTFKMKCSRAEALKIIKHSDKTRYPQGNLDFFEHVLN